jgi:hypothetical protein
MTDSADFRRVKETEALAKRLGFKLEHRSGGIIIRAAKELPAAVFGKNEDIITPFTVEEVRSWLRGWANLASAIEDIGFTEEEYKKRIHDKKVLDALKKKAR